MKLVKDVVTKASKAIKNRRNTESLTQAQAAVILGKVALSFVDTKDKAPDLKLVDFLPHPEIWEQEREENTTKLKPETMQTIKEILNNKSLIGIAKKLIKVGFKG